MQLDKIEENEMEKLLDEIPHVTSPQYHNQDHHHHHLLSSPLSSYDMHGHGHAHGMDDVNELIDRLQSVHITKESADPFLFGGNLGVLAPKIPMGPSPYSVLPFNGVLSENLNVGFSHPPIPEVFIPSKVNGFDPYWDSNALNISILRSPTRSLSPAESFQNVDLRKRSLFGSLGSMYLLAKDKHGSSFLQDKLVEGRHWVDSIFDGVIGNISELMVDSFGNYLMQKLFPVCSEGQKTTILLVLTEDPSTIFRLSLDSHGTRSVQKLIETLKSHHQIALVMAALRPGLLDLIKNVNGNHVIQNCLASLRTEDAKCIYDVATKHFMDIATHQHGCCVMQRCIGCSTGGYQANLVEKVTSNALKLSEDAYGNYVVQYAISAKFPSAHATFASQFEGNYVQLSMQKFGSHVVEKCFREFGENLKTTIVLELLSAPKFEQLLQHPFANYVIHNALLNTKGALHATLVGAIRPHTAILRTSPYCKRISLLLSRKICVF